MGLSQFSVPFILRPLNCQNFSITIGKPSADSVGGFARRNIALAGARTLAFLAIVGEDRPDFRTIRALRTVPLGAFQAVVGQVGRLVGEAGVVTWGTVSTDGTNSQGHASCRQARSAGERQKDVGRLREDIEALVPRALPARCGCRCGLREPSRRGTPRRVVAARAALGDACRGEAARGGARQARGGGSTDAARRGCGRPQAHGSGTSRHSPDTGRRAP